MFANRIRRINTPNASANPARAHGGPGAAGIEYDDSTDQIVLSTDNPPTDAGRRFVATVAAQAGATAKSILVFTATANPVSVAANTSVEQGLPVTGVLTTDTVVAVIKPTHTVGFAVTGGRVSAAGTVAATFVNPTAVASDPPAETWTFVIAR